MTENTTIRVAGAIADKKSVTLYLEDGETMIIPQTDHRLGDLMDAILPITSVGKVAVIDIEKFSVYAAFEKKAASEGTGLVKFFKVAKKALSGLWGTKEEPVAEEAEKPKTLSPETMVALRNKLDGTTDAPAVEMITEEVAAPLVQKEIAQQTQEDRIKEHLEPVGHDEVIKDEETIVAVVAGNVVPNIEKIKPIIENAVKHNSPAGVENFLRRAGAIIDKRQHSVEDLFTFLEKGDLPLADDGSIIAYKVLNYHLGNQDLFVDCHTGKVKQRVGSYVCVDESLVDLNRRNECSNGLHIARRGYLGSFSGSVLVLCKIDPEDVMTVPHGDANKVRVKGYHILGKLSNEAWSLLRSGRPMTTENSALESVYRAIKGDHIDRIEEVRVHGQQGRNVIITPLKNSGKHKPQELAENIKQGAALDDTTAQSGTTVDPREINRRVNEEIQKQNTAAQVEEEIPGTETLEADLAAAVEATDYEELASDLGYTIEEVDENADNDDEDAEEDITYQLYDPNGEFIEGFNSEQEAWKRAYDHAESLTVQSPEAKEDARVTEEVLALSDEEKEAVIEKHDEIRDAAASHMTPDKNDPVVARNAEEAAREKKRERDRAYKARKAAEKAAEIEAQAKNDEAKRPKRQKAPGKKATDAVKETVTQPKAGTKTKQSEARELFNAGKFQELKDFKKRVKKGWEALGFTDKEVEQISPETH